MTIRIKDLPLVTETTAGDRIALDGATTRAIDVSDLLGAGSGDVVGPASATDNAVVRFDLTTGKLVQNSAVTIADTTGLIAGSRFANSGLKIEDTNASHLLAIAAGSDLTADRTLTITTGDSARTLTLNADITPMGQGKHTIWIPASAMWARTTNGPAAASRELTTGGDIMVKGLAFDTTTEEAAQFYIGFPKSWNKGTITFQAFWTNVSGLTTETVSWGLSAGAYTDSDAIDSTDLGTEVRVSDTWLAANDIHVSAESGAVTVGNTPIDDDMVIGQIARSVANDNMTGDAELLGIKIFYTTSAATDA